VLTFSLQSGSNGNSIYVEADGVRLLFDCGLSGQLAALRMAARGRELDGIDALIISHEHDDHVRGAGIFQRKFGIPIWITRRTLRRSKAMIGPVSDVRHFTAGERIEFGSVRVFTIPTPHDAAEPVCFVIEHAGRRLGILTDLGHPFRALPRILEDLDAAYLESNYDPEMLATGPYPAALKARIRGQHGHLSNEESAALSARAARGRLRWVAAAHLSEVNNDPELALNSHRRGVGRTFPVHLASRYAVGDILEI
jgi:phosphoribosyl 1,2-cyclic phosphodiesterase